MILFSPMLQAPPLNSIKTRSRLQKPGFSPTPPQGALFHVEKQIEIDGVEMVVLENGVPYLTERGLARMCGIDRKVLNRLAINWKEEQSKPRGKQISDLLLQSNYAEDSLYLKSDHNGIES